MEKPSPYRAYLIRLWPTRRQGVAGCRVRLQCVTTGEQINFPDLDDLFSFLQAQAVEWADRTTEEDVQEGGDA
jgi:hypothetical protein